MCVHCALSRFMLSKVTVLEANAIWVFKELKSKANLKLFFKLKSPQKVKSPVETSLTGLVCAQPSMVLWS